MVFVKWKILVYAHVLYVIFVIEYGNFARWSVAGVGIADGLLGKELSSLAKEVARMETVRMYAGELLLAGIFPSLFPRL